MGPPTQNETYARTNDLLGPARSGEVEPGFDQDWIGAGGAQDGTRDEVDPAGFAGADKIRAASDGTPEITVHPRVTGEAGQDDHEVPFEEWQLTMMRRIASLPSVDDEEPPLDVEGGPMTHRPGSAPLSSQDRERFVSSLQHHRA